MIEEDELKDFTKKALVREYLDLQKKTIKIIDVSNDLYGFIADNFEPDEEFDEMLKRFDNLVDTVDIWRENS